MAAAVLELRLQLCRSPKVSKSLLLKVLEAPVGIGSVSHRHLLTAVFLQQVFCDKLLKLLIKPGASLKQRPSVANRSFLLAVLGGAITRTCEMQVISGQSSLLMILIRILRQKDPARSTRASSLRYPIFRKHKRWPLKLPCLTLLLHVTHTAIAF